MPNENYRLAEAYLKRINDKLKLKTHLGGEDTRSGIEDEESGGYVGHLFPNMSMLYSAIFTAEQLITLREKNDKQKQNSLEIKAHYWDKWGADLHRKDQARKQKAFDKKEAERKAKQ